MTAQEKYKNIENSVCQSCQSVYNAQKVSTHANSKVNKRFMEIEALLDDSMVNEILHKSFIIPRTVKQVHRVTPK